MKRNLLHTPEGVRDIYNEECKKKMKLQDKLQTMLKQYGYHGIQTPTFEYFDIFSQEIGTTPSKDLYKFFDREGNTLALRPDITPSVARSVTKYFGEEDMPIRLWYQGNTFINNLSYQGRLKETTQLGAELIGDNSVDGDGEIVSMIVSLLKTAGLNEFQISIGHIDFFNGLVKEANLEEEMVEELITLISNKNYFGVDEVIESIDIPKDLKTLFHSLGKLYHNIETLEELKKPASSYPVILNSIDRLIQLYEVLSCYEIEKYVTIELGMLSNYQYYTGIIFSAYTFGSGEPIVKGGRYDDLLPYFGKQAASIGFAVVIDQLLFALSRQKIEIEIKETGALIVYKDNKRKEAIFLAQRLRREAQEITLIKWNEAFTKEQYEQYASRMHLANTTFLD